MRKENNFKQQSPKKAGQAPQLLYLFILSSEDNFKKVTKGSRKLFFKFLASFYLFSAIHHLFSFCQLNVYNPQYFSRSMLFFSVKHPLQLIIV